jgi:hypothetical protein
VSRHPQKNPPTPPEWTGTHLRAYPAWLHAVRAHRYNPIEGSTLKYLKVMLIMYRKGGCNP